MIKRTQQSRRSFRLHCARKGFLLLCNEARCLVYIALIALLTTSCGRPEQPTVSDKTPERIISLAPNITGTLFDLGLSNRVVGVTRFSNLNPELEMPIVGDFMNVNYERLVTLQPDLVILETSADTQKDRLKSLGIPYLETCSLSISNIIESIRNIGEKCDASEQADLLIEDFNTRKASLRNAPPHRLRTLITFSDFSNHDQVEQIYAFGANCIHSELLRIAGGDNVVADTRPSVILSREAIIRLNPELIIELSTGGPTNQWSNLSSVAAVKNDRIRVVEGTYTTIPSPTCLMQTLEDLSRIIRQSGFIQ